MIRHTVAFRLKHPAGSPSEAAFLADALVLREIPGVERFEQLRQVSARNEFHFGFSMEFADQAAYDTYNAHPDHVAFVRDRWVPEVEAFLEIDYVLLTRRVGEAATPSPEEHPSATETRRERNPSVNSDS